MKVGDIVTYKRKTYYYAGYVSIRNETTEKDLNQLVQRLENALHTLTTRTYQEDGTKLAVQLLTREVTSSQILNKVYEDTNAILLIDVRTQEKKHISITEKKELVFVETSNQKDFGVTTDRLISPVIEIKVRTLLSNIESYRLSGKNTKQRIVKVYYLDYVVNHLKESGYLIEDYKGKRIVERIDGLGLKEIGTIGNKDFEDKLLKDMVERIG